MVADLWPDEPGNELDSPQPGAVHAWEPAAAGADAAPLVRPGRSLPSLGLIGELLGHSRAGLEAAALRELSMHPRTRWTLPELEEGLPWLDPDAILRLVGELEDAGLLIHDPAGDTWRLSDQARVVAAACGALAPGMEPGPVVRALAAAIALAQATGAPAEATAVPLKSAVTVLEADYDRLVGLIQERAEPELAQAAELARGHAADMAALLAAEREALERLEAEGRWRGLAQRAAAAAGRLDALAGEVLAVLSGRAESVLLPGVDRRELRELVAATGLERLGELVAEDVGRLPALPPVDPAALFAVLDRLLGAADGRPAPLPEPVVLFTEPPPESVPDLVELARGALEWLGTQGGGLLTEWVVGGSWAQAAARMTAVVEAWSRHGPAGDGGLGVTLHPLPLVDALGRDQVGIASRTTVRGEGAGS